MRPILDDVRRQLGELFEKADRWPNDFNLARLGGFVLSHPEIVEREETPRMIADKEYKRRRRVT